jgi:hypothetical protein
VKPFTNAELLAVGEKLKLVLPIEEFVFRKQTETALEITIVIKKRCQQQLAAEKQGNI